MLIKGMKSGGKVAKTSNFFQEMHNVGFNTCIDLLKAKKVDHDEV